MTREYVLGTAGDLDKFWVWVDTDYVWKMPGINTAAARDMRGI